MKAFMKWMCPFLLVFALITQVPAGHAGDISQKSPLLPGEAEDTPLASVQAPTAGAGSETIVLAAARNMPDGSFKSKKASKAKEPPAGTDCIDGTLKKGTGDDITIDNFCTVGAGTYNYGFVNIIEGGTLNFQDQNIDFWAKSILVENKGSLVVGSSTNPIDNTVTFHLYGDDTQTAGITCQAKNCGVPDDYWRPDPPKNFKLKMPSGVTDYFYQYEILPADNQTGQLTEGGYFGIKTLAVSYGGTLQMFGKKGAEYQDPKPHDSPGLSGESWVRLDKSVAAGGTELVLDRKVDTWEKGDWIVVTATDYIPNHSEMQQIDNVATENDHTKITLKTALSYPHNGEKYDLTKHNIPHHLNKENDFMKAVDTRAAVALLTRSIRIVSEGAAFKQPLPAPDDSSTGRYFGGHVIARQGFKTFQMQGVELKQLGQGGRMAHSPVNFHMARKLPAEGQPNPAFVIACSVNESMTRMYEIRGTQGVILKRNVGYKSIGHGYFLAEGTETGNILEANIGIYSRPAVDYRDNPRKVPGILAKQIFYDTDTADDKSNFGAYGGDYIHPSVFFITNGYNSFEDNMAVGAGTCGACYWIAPAKIGGLSMKQTWESYAGIQQKTPGAAPLYRFHGNFCSTAQYSLITIGTPGTCSGVQTPNLVADAHALQPISNPFEVNYRGRVADTTNRGLYPNIDSGAALQATKCDKNQPNWPDCSNVQPQCIKGSTENCAVNVIDSYTSSFHWAQQNYSAIWLRTNWFLFTNSALTDVLNGGLTMVSGGSWDQVLNRYWALTRKSVFVGSTQQDTDNVYAQNRGPVNPDTIGKSKCLSYTNNLGKDQILNYCRVQRVQGDNLTDEGIVIPKDNFSVYQRLYNIYDGPVYQEANAYVNIKKREVTGCDEHVSQDYPAGKCHPETNFMYYSVPGIPRATEAPLKDKCFMPNAAIGWKQPNGFYYPPAFHSKNLFFDDVDIRHYVIVPLFKPGTLDGNATAIERLYCSYPPPTVDANGMPVGNLDNPATLFDTSWTDIDRQTELNDDDGSLSGLSGAHSQQDSQNGTVSVNRDQFYYAPKTPFECLSEQSCYQSPYDYVSAVVFPSQPWPAHWDINADSRLCYGVPIYRQYLNEGEKADKEQGIRMLGAAIYQRSTMIANKGKYYIDTTVSAKTQNSQFVNEFQGGAEYNFFLIYAKPSTKVTYQLYVGADLDVANDLKLIRVGNPLKDGKVLRAWAGEDFISPDDNWPSGWSRTYSSNTGILEVTMDLGLNQFATDFNNGAMESCGPTSFCKWKDGKCGCADPNPMNPIGFPCEDSICAWSSLRSECPENGCLGFQVKFPATFVADDKNHRPAPEAFPASWYVTWEKADQGLCHDETLEKKLEQETPIGYDTNVYPVGPCYYSGHNEIPANAPLPSSGGTVSMDN